MTSQSAHSEAPEPSSTGAPPADPGAAAVAVWLGHFSRTLKTCRLYDAKNPTTVKFREDLGTRLVALLEEHGPVTLEFSATEVKVGGTVVMTARSREDNLAMPFYRDGLRSLTFQPGLTPDQLDAVVDLVLRVTGRRTSGSEDLVTLLWDADLSHVDMKYVSAETDADLADEGEQNPNPTHEHPADPMPWPAGAEGATSGASDAPGQATTVTGVRLELVQAKDPGPLRSEDWLAEDPVHELETCYAELEPTRAAETERFSRELHQEREAGLVERMLDLVRSMLFADLLPGDLADLSALLRRLLDESIADGRWGHAQRIVADLARMGGGTWDPAPLLEELVKPESMATASAVRHLDAGGNAELGEFTDFARAIGSPTAGWLMCIVTLAEQQRTRRALLRAIIDLCAGKPDALVPWLADERWEVVRNAVSIVASAEGGARPEWLRPLLTHPEARVRQEVVAAAAQMAPDAAHPLLLALLRDVEPTVRFAAMHLLGLRRNAEAAAALQAIVTEPAFRKRPIEEVRSVTTALGGCAGDAELPALEGQLGGTQWFGGGGDAPYLQAIARCIGRIGTSAALAILERGAASRAAATRDACKLVLKGMGRG